MSRYAQAHKTENLDGPGDGRPTALQIVRDEGREGDLAGKVVVITGCSSGLGPPTAAAMAATGATVYCAARDVDKARAALGDVLLGSKEKRVHVLQLDLASLASVGAFADEVAAREPAGVNVLINNAGVMMVPERALTADGFELQAGTNHLAHFYLFCRLRGLLRAGAARDPSFGSRVVNVASSAHRYCPAQLDDFNLARPGAYDGAKAYSSSKTANIHMANHLDRLYGGDEKIHGYSLMPGAAFTPLQKHIPAEMDRVRADRATYRWMKSPEQCAATTVFAAVARELEGKGGVYLEDCAVGRPVAPGLDESGDGRREPGYAAWAFDRESEERLWEMSLDMVGLGKGDI